MKTRNIIILILIILVVFFASGCDSEEITSSKSAIKLGVIESTGYIDRSYFHLFDENLNYIKIEKNNYSALCEPPDKPIYCNGDLYAIPKGNFDSRDNYCAIKYNIATNNYFEYDLELQTMNCLALNEDYIFGVNTINGESRIAKHSLSTGELKEAVFPNLYIPKIAVLDNNLYAIIAVYDESAQDRYYLANISIDNLEINYQVDITEYGSPSKLYLYDNCIYMPIQMATDGSASSLIAIYDLKSNDLSSINLNISFPNDLFIIDDLLIVSHFDTVNITGNKITIYDLKSKKNKVVNFDFNLKQVSNDSSNIYILGDDEKIYKYILKDKELNKVGECEINKDKTNTHYYISSFFIIDE